MSATGNPGCKCDRAKYICSLSLKCERKLSVLNPSVLQPGCIMVLLRTCENCVFLNACMFQKTLLLSTIKRSLL